MDYRKQNSSNRRNNTQHGFSDSGKKGGRSSYRDGRSSYSRYGKKDDRSFSGRDFHNQDDKPFRSRSNNADTPSYTRREDHRMKSHPVPDKSIIEESPVLPQEETELPNLLIGRNAVREALKNGRSIDKILVIKNHDGSLGEIVSLARDRNMILHEVDRKKLDELCMPFGHGGKTANHQGIVAYAAGVEYCSISDILAVAKAKEEPPFVLVLDGIEDPHNLGSIIRSAECAGAHGVIIGKRRSASVTPAVIKASSGATEYVKIARVVNISGAIQELKRTGLWIAGADMSGSPMTKQNLKGALALVIGNEGNGLTKLVKDNCDFLVSIPQKGRIDSLNASNAATVLMYEKLRQDDSAND